MITNQIYQLAAYRDFSRRRWTEDGIRIASRYLATVRLAISTPVSCNNDTILSSERTFLGSSESINCRIRNFTVSAEWSSSLSRLPKADEKKYFSSKTPRSHIKYLFEVTRLMVDSWTGGAIGERERTPAKWISTWQHGGEAQWGAPHLKGTAIDESEDHCPQQKNIVDRHSKQISCTVVICGNDNGFKRQRNQ